jgi:hypothetical protein
MPADENSPHDVRNMKTFSLNRFLLGIAALWLFPFSLHAEREPAGGALAGERLRVLISTDIGGSDEDDIQSMIHFLMYADLFDIEGLVSSPPNKGREADILKVIDAYENDYPKLIAQSGKFPTPESLRAVTRQGATDPAPEEGFSDATKGSDWIIQRALHADPRPLYVLVWGSITDVAQALHDKPAIKQQIRVHFISSWNRLQDPHAFNYIEKHHSDLWMIQDESSFRGWFTGGKQGGDLGNGSFVRTHIDGRGALGKMFGLLKAAHAEDGAIKMGDTPTVARLLRGTPDDPTRPSWGGQFTPHPERPRWWVDVSGKEWQQERFPGAKTVNQWREDYLRDWQLRVRWLE